MPPKRRRKTSRQPQLLALAGLAILVIAILAFKEKEAPAAEFIPNPNQLAEVQLDRALEAGRPVLAFFHSNNCEKCLIMMDTVAQVYPEYQDAVVLVDINVYDDRNQDLLKRVRLQYIPTLIFYDQAGQSEVQIGVMEAEDLSSRLAALAGEP